MLFFVTINQGILGTIGVLQVTILVTRPSEGSEWIRKSRPSVRAFKTLVQPIPNRTMGHILHPRTDSRIVASGRSGSFKLNPCVWDILERRATSIQHGHHFFLGSVEFRK